MRGRGMAATVGRLRPVQFTADWKFVVLSHNTIRGAAGAAVLNAEVLALLGKLDKLGVKAETRQQAGGDGFEHRAREAGCDEVRRHFWLRMRRRLSGTAAIVRGRRQRGLEAVVVVSAMAKVTDFLLTAAAAAGRGDKTGALAIASETGGTDTSDTCGSEIARWGAIYAIACGATSGVRCAGRSAAWDCGCG